MTPGRVRPRLFERRAQPSRHGTAPQCLRERAGRLAVVTCLVWAGSSRAVAQPLAEVVPRGVVAAYFARPGAALESSRAPWSALKLATFVADRANQAGLLSNLDQTSRQWIDVAAALSVVFDYPHALALLEVEARPCSEAGHELAALQAALIIRTGGDNTRITERIQHLLGVYTNTQNASLAKRSGGGATWFSLRDSRLAAWTLMTWGSYGDYYVVAIGEGTFERIVATIRDPRTSLRHDAWFDRASARRGARTSGATGETSRRQNVETSKRQDVETSRRRSRPTDSVGLSIEPSYAWYVRFDLLRRSSDASFDAKVQWVQYSLGLAGVDRGLWMAGQSPATGSVEVFSVHHREDRDTVHRLAGEYAGASLPDDAVPHLAGGFAVIDCVPSAVWRGASDAYYGARSPGVQEDCELGFAQIEEESGVSIERDIVSMLDGPVVIHNYPRHALRLPLAWTLLAPIRGDSRVLRDRVDKAFRAAAKVWTGEKGVQFRRTADNIWHLEYGFAGPALVITDRWLILSFSPNAIRQNLALLSSQANRP